MGDRADRTARRFEVPVLVAALLVVPVIVVEGRRTPGRSARYASCSWAWLRGLLTAALAQQFFFRVVEEEVRPEEDELLARHKAPETRLDRLEEAIRRF